LNCDDVIREISNYLDGELAPPAKQDLEGHLDQCHDCKMVVNQTKLTVEVFCDSELVELPSDVKSRLHEALRRKLGCQGN
jgi:anti-sigma factor RsiW